MTGIKPDESEAAKIRALTNPLRRRALCLMLQKPAKSGVSPSEIAQELNRPLSNVSYHVRILAACGAIRLKRTKPVRGSIQHFYTPCPKFMALPWVPALLEAVTRDPE